ncbi:MAG TPA: lytic transglycosylase domain-containing protein [Solirubrobacteraceae bacterium]|nr:lytic transglycosylase domain-containing protein [Solirubrobacteraceae bacterium]
MGATQRRVSYSEEGYSSQRQGRHGGSVRRLIVTVLTLAVLAAGGVALVPLVRRAIQHFELPLQYASIIRQQAAQKHLDPALIAAVIYAETRFQPRTSSTGAEGLMQIEPATARFLAHRSGATAFTLADLGTPQVNIAYGSYYLRYLMNEYGGSKVLALAAYNGGDTNVNIWLGRARARHERFTIADIPLATGVRAYVSEVLSKQHAYRSKYARQLGYT